MPAKRHILVTGGTGQLGLALARTAWPDDVVLHRPGSAQLDLRDQGSIRRELESRHWAAIINSGAYTAVDKAESELSTAFAVNAMAPAVLAEGAKALGIPIVQVSTDYVFSGSKTEPYVEDDPVGPLGVYGASKLAGELAVRNSGARHVVLRTAWVLSPDRTNFLKTMLRLAETRPELGVVDDQQGCPSSADDIASAVAAVTRSLMDGPDGPHGVYHFVNAGVCSWADLARHIFDLSAAHGGPSATVNDITTADYPTPATRPANSALATDKITRDFGVRPRPWREAVADIIDTLQTEPTA